MLHRVGADQPAGEQHGERVGDGACEAEAAGYYAYEETRERVEPYHDRERRNDRKHREHLLELTEERAEAHEHERYRRHEQHTPLAEAPRRLADKHAYTADVVHHLERREYYEQEQREHYQREPVVREEHEHRRKEPLPDGYAGGAVQPLVLKIIRAAVGINAEAALRYHPRQSYRRDHKREQQRGDLYEGLFRKIDQRSRFSFVFRFHPTTP